ncbi:hypothetical protein ILYODFUR_026293 [Ilyodon furcidens]|uniref:Uncharacterized protein n=1 Tax=Ilyodon furcidens TaxID=33524 RepID=A0ABV0UVN2_9TELE
MEETVRSLLQNQDSLEGPKVDPLDLMKAYKDKLLEEMWKQQDSLEGPTAAETPSSPEAGGGSEEDSKDSNPLLERLRALEVNWVCTAHFLPFLLLFPVLHHFPGSDLHHTSLKCQTD